MHFFGAWGSFSFLIGFVISLTLIFNKIYGISQGLKVRDVVDQPLFYIALIGIIVGVQLFLAGYLAELINLDSNKKSDYQIADKSGI